MTDFAKLFFETACQAPSPLVPMGDHATFEGWLAAEYEAYDDFIAHNFGHLPEPVVFRIGDALAGDCYAAGAHYGMTREQTQAALDAYHN